MHSCSHVRHSCLAIDLSKPTLKQCIFSSIAPTATINLIYHMSFFAIDASFEHNSGILLAHNSEFGNIGNHNGSLS